MSVCACRGEKWRWNEHLAWNFAIIQFDTEKSTVHCEIERAQCNTRQKNQWCATIQKGQGCTTIQKGQGCTTIQKGQGCTMIQKGQGCTTIQKGQGCTTIQKGQECTMELYLQFFTWLWFCDRDSTLKLRVHYQKSVLMYVYVCICVLKCAAPQVLCSSVMYPECGSIGEEWTPSCIIVTIPQAHLHLALYVRLEERDDIKTPALRAGIKNHTHKNIFTAFLHASKIKFTAKKHCSPLS